MVEQIAFSGGQRHILVAAGKCEQEVDERRVVVEGERRLRAAEAAEIAAKPGGDLDHVGVGIPGGVRRDDDHRLRLTDVGGESLHAAHGRRHGVEIVAAYLGDEERRMWADAALHDRVLPPYACSSRPRSVVEVAASTSTSTIAPASAAPVKFTVTFCEVRPRSPSPRRLGPSTRTSTRLPTRRRLASRASRWVASTRRSTRSRPDLSGTLRREVGGGGAGARREDEGEGALETRPFDDVQGGGELLLRLSREAGDEVGRDADPGHRLAQSGHALEVRGGGVRAPHRGEDSVRARLQRQVDVLTDARQLGNRPHEVVREVFRVRRHEADSRDAAARVEQAQQRREVDGVSRSVAAQVEAVGVHVLAKESDLADPVGGERPDLGEDSTAGRLRSRPRT